MRLYSTYGLRSDGAKHLFLKKVDVAKDQTKVVAMTSRLASIKAFPQKMILETRIYIV